MKCFFFHSCVQCAAPTLVRTTARVDSSQKLGRRCATAGEATAGRAAAWVSEERDFVARVSRSLPRVCFYLRVHARVRVR